VDWIDVVVLPATVFDMFEQKMNDGKALSLKITEGMLSTCCLP